MFLSDSIENKITKIKMRKIIYTISIALAVFVQSCELDVEPTDAIEDSLVFENVENAEKVLNGTWAYLMDTYTTYQNPGWSCLLRASDAMADDVAVQPGKYGYITHYSFSNMNSTTSTTGRAVWTLSYKTIDNMNHLITKIDDIPGDEDLKQRIKGQAYALRGYIYLNLVTFYAHPYTYDLNEKCVPIYTEPSTEGTTGNPRSTVKQVYDRAESDLLQADVLLASYKRSVKYKMDKNVVAGILARLYLQKNDWINAQKYALAAQSSSAWMSKNEYLNGFNELDNIEWIWGHGQTPEQNTASYSFNFLDVSSKSSYYYSFMADPFFKDLFDDNDVRNELFEWDTARYKGGLMYKKFKFRSNSTADIVLMRKAEMVLIEAESYAEQNKLAEAIEKLNELRVRRGAETPDLSSLSKEKLVEEILIERRKELFGEGFGLSDLKRRQKSVERRAAPNKFIPNSTDIKMKGHTILKFSDGTKFVANSSYYNFAIPASEVTNNPNL